MRYELHLTNFSDSSASITDVVIVDETTEKPLARIDGAELLHAVEIVGARNPTRRDALVESGRRAIVYLDFEPRAAPSGTLRHDLFFDILATSRAHHSKVVIRGSRVDKRPAAVFGPPLRGGPWVAVYEPRLERGHRRVVYATQGKAKIPGRFAIDWMRPTSSSAQGPDLVLEEGATIEVLSIADGVIAATRDGVPEPGPNERPEVSLEDATGNYISLRITPDRYVFYEHLLPGLLVRPGDQVKRGQVIAQVGSTGQANRPHLHLHLADSDSPLDAEGFPYALEEAEVIGTYRSIEEFDRGAPWEKLSRPSTLRSIPGPNVVIQFPK